LFGFFFKEKSPTIVVPHLLVLVYLHMGSYLVENSSKRMWNTAYLSAQTQKCELPRMHVIMTCAFVTACVPAFSPFRQMFSFADTSHSFYSCYKANVCMRLSLFQLLMATMADIFLIICFRLLDSY
jgi:hypothetical protein